MKEYSGIVYGGGFLKANGHLINIKNARSFKFTLENSCNPCGTKTEGLIISFGDGEREEIPMSKDQWSALQLWLLEG